MTVRGGARGRRGTSLATALLICGTLATGVAHAADLDADGIDSESDNCPAAFNPLQADCNADGVGDACNTAGAAGTDGDRDGICNPADNCPGLPNVDQGDCNGNGIGDLCEGANANRDNDRDGVCNGADACPFEAGACAMQAITVPWVPANPNIAHPTYSGATHTLKGIARYGGNQFMWDYGDGSPPMAWTAIANPYNLGVNHVYTGAVGQTFIATLSVRNSANPGVVATATYRVKIFESGPLPVAAPYAMDPNRMDVRIDMAIDQGLWYLHTTMTRATYPDGSPGYAQPYGYWAGVLAGSCTALDAFLLHGSKPNKDYATDPYVETSQRALNYILASNTQSAAIANQTHAGVVDRPDYDGNGVGILFGPNDTYVNGICGVAVASAGTPNRQSLVGNAAYQVRGRTYKDLAQDMAEWFAYGQADGGNHRGGWHYSANQQSADGSTNQWPMLAIAAAEDNMAITTPRFVRTEAPYFMNYTRHAGLDSRHGGWGYESANDVYVNHVKTAAGILYHFFLGNAPSHPEVQAALGFLYRHWSLNNYNGGGAWNVGLGNSYAMYGIMKAMRKPQPNILRITEYNYNTRQQTANSFDWYYTPPGQTQEGIATNLVRRQAASGMWSDAIGNNAQSGAFATGWGVLILSRGVTTIPPDAEICNCDFTWDRNQDVTMDGACSTHPDLNRRIVSYEWDFNYVGGTFDTETTGVDGLEAGGYPAYGTYTVGLRVTDDNPAELGGPQSAITSCNITIKPPNNCPHPNAGGPYLGNHGVAFPLDATASVDPDGDALAFAWDLDNDGHFDDAAGATPSVTFDRAGTFAVAVQVTDVRNDGGATQPCARVAYSTVEIGNHAPVASPGGPYSGRPGQAVTLDGSLSSDPDGDAITYGWDLNNDGVFTDSTLARPSFTVPANAAGGQVFSVCLKVTDALGRASETRCSSVTVQLNNAPTCRLDDLAVSTCVEAGRMEIALSGAGQDADGDGLTYRWTTNCANATVQNDRAPEARLGLAAACDLACKVTLTVDDGKTTGACEANVRADDDTDPTFVRLPVSTEVECGASNADELTDWLADVGGALDDCSAATITQTSAVVADDAGCRSVTTYRFTAADDCDNTTVQERTFTIVDETAPAFVNAPADLVVESDGAGNAAELAAWRNAPTAEDACGVAGVSGQVGELGDGCGATGAVTGTWVAADACGHAVERTATFTIVDSKDPAFTTAPADVTVECRASGHDADIAAWLASAAATDANGAAIANDYAGLAASCGRAGSARVTWTAADACGNDATTSATYTVEDTTPPRFFLAPADGFAAECDGAGNDADLQAWLANVGADDECGGEVLPVEHAITATEARCGATGATTARFSTVDACGLETAVSATFIVRDTTPPTLSAPARDLEVECDGEGNRAQLAAWLESVAANDACGAATVSHEFGGLSDLCGATGAGAATWTATDACGLKSAPASATFTIVDTTKPAFTLLPQDKSVESDGAGNVAELQAWLAAVAAHDGCGDVTITNDFDGLSDGPGHTGSATVTWTATDACGRNTETASATFRIVDSTPPTVTCPADATIELGADDCAASASYTASAVDVDGGASSQAHTFVFTKPETRSHTFTFTDDSGNTASCTQRVTAVDVTAPVVTCAADETLNLSADTCQASKTYTATARDACGGAMSQQHTFGFSQPGSDAHTYTFTDPSGHSASCTQTVRAADVTPPVYTAGPTKLLWPPNHQYEAVTLASCGTFRDSCGGAINPDAGAGRIARVSSDEAELAKGSGNTRDDMVIRGASSVGLRAEREGGGNGRVYTIHFSVGDPSGVSTGNLTCKVAVPHDQGRSGAPVEGAPVHWVNAP